LNKKVAQRLSEELWHFDSLLILFIALFIGVSAGIVYAHASTPFCSTYLNSKTESHLSFPNSHILLAQTKTGWDTHNLNTNATVLTIASTTGDPTQVVKWYYQYLLDNNWQGGILSMQDTNPITAPVGAGFGRGGKNGDNETIVVAVYPASSPDLISLEHQYHFSSPVKDSVIWFSYSPKKSSFFC
jgi:hypothetical protein